MKPLRALAIFLLVFNGLSALAGGGLLLIDPSGGTLQIPLSVLQYSPFNDFWIPGLLLFVCNGLLSIWIAWLVIRKHPQYRSLISLQGLVSMIWILTQVIMIRTAVALHYIYGGIGLALFFIGLQLVRSARPRAK